MTSDAGTLGDTKHKFALQPALASSHPFVTGGLLTSSKRILHQPVPLKNLWAARPKRELLQDALESSGTETVAHTVFAPCTQGAILYFPDCDSCPGTKAEAKAHASRLVLAWIALTNLHLPESVLSQWIMLRSSLTSFPKDATSSRK